ncbi:unnamed protein product [Ectocarpus fasciculatus]
MNVLSFIVRHRRGGRRRCCSRPDEQRIESTRLHQDETWRKLRDRTAGQAGGTALGGPMPSNAIIRSAVLMSCRGRIKTVCPDLESMLSGDW